MMHRLAASSSAAAAAAVAVRRASVCVHPSAFFSTARPLSSLTWGPTDVHTNTPDSAPPGFTKVVKQKRTFEEAGAAAIAREEAAAKAQAEAQSQSQAGQSTRAKQATSGRSVAKVLAAAAAEDYGRAAEHMSASSKLVLPPTAPVSSEPAVPLTPASEVVWLYRITLRHVRVLDDPARRASAQADARTHFRELQAAAAAPNASEDAGVQKRLATAYSRLSFLRMSTPKLRQPRIRDVPAYEGARKLFGSPINTAAYVGGEMLTEAERARMLAEGGTVGGRNVVNSQGITDEQRKRHHALVERMNFRGPHWAGKPKF